MGDRNRDDPRSLAGRLQVREAAYDFGGRRVLREDPSRAWTSVTAAQCLAGYIVKVRGKAGRWLVC